MPKEIKIAPVEQYIIDQIRKIRLSLNITAELLSKNITPSESAGLVGNVESSASKTTYTSHNLNLIADFFTKHAKMLKDDSVQKEYTIYDFYPPEPLEDLPIVKSTYEIPRKIGPTFIVADMLENTNFLDSPKTITQVTDYINAHYDVKYKSTNINSALKQAGKKDLLEINMTEELRVTYQKKKNNNKNL